MSKIQKTQNGGTGSAAQSARIADLVKIQSTLERDNAVAWHRFAKLCVEAIKSDGIKQTDLATRLGRSKGWMSRVVKITTLPEPKSTEDCRALLATLHGKSGVGKAKSGKAMSAEEAIKAAIAFARKAVKLGADADAVVDALTEALTAEESAEGEATSEAVAAMLARAAA